jgi:hypothetical protein
MLIYAQAMACRFVLCVVTSAVASVSFVPSSAIAYRACGVMFIDVKDIRAEHITCKPARRVVRKNEHL